MAAGQTTLFQIPLVIVLEFALSALIWLIVTMATLAPMTVLDVARFGERHVHDRLPEEIRQRLPEDLRMKLTGSQGFAVAVAVSGTRLRSFLE